MEKKRNYGIDLLRIIATFMIIVLHILGAGGIIYTIDASRPLYITAWGLELAAYCAVNCYALISGYVGICSKFKFSNIFQLWLQVATTTIAITVAFLFQGGNATIQDVMKSCMPIKNQYYWYFTAYVCLYFMTPFLNWFILNIEVRMAKKLVLTLMLFFSVIPTFFEADLFVIHNGYSVLWLMVLYIVGGLIKKYQSHITIKKRILVCGYLGAVALTLILKLTIEYLTPMVSFEFLESNFLMNYNSPTIVVAGLCLLLLFMNLKLEKMRKIISLFAPTTFGIYIIHSQPMIWDRFIVNGFSKFKEFGVIEFVIAVIVTSIVIFASCSLIELFRIRIFKMLHISELCKKIEEKASIRRC